MGFLHRILSLSMLVCVAAFRAEAQPSELYRFTGREPGIRLGASVACLATPFSNNSTTSDLAYGEPGRPTVGGFSVFRGSNGTTEIFSSDSGEVAFGQTMAYVGDVNADGLGDIVVGDPAGDTAVLFHSAGSVAVPLFSSTVNGNNSFGRSLAGYFQDLDDDDHPEVLVGAPQHSRFGFSGYVGVFSSAQGAAVAEFQGMETNMEFGFSVASIQDLEDTSPEREIVIGAPNAGGGAGRVLIYSVQSSTSPFDTIDSPSENSIRFGHSVAAVPDANGDGVEDILIGAPASFVGNAYLYSGQDRTLLCTMSGEENSDFGSAVASVGDIDQDGRPDFAIGAPGDNGGRGALYIYSFSNTNGCERKITFNGTTTGERLGISVAGTPTGSGSICDLDGDKRPDFAAGSEDSSVATDGGAAIFYRSGNPLPPEPLPTSGRFSYRIDREGVFTGMHVLNQSPLGRCRLTLYGRRTNSDGTRRGPIQTIVSKKLALRETTFSGVRLRKPRLQAPGRPYLYHMVVRTKCEKAPAFLSNVFARRMTCGEKPPIGIDRWEAALPTKVR